MTVRVPPYFDYLIEGFQRGATGRHVHLGYWSAPPPARSDNPAQGEFAQAQRRLDDLLLDLAGLGDGQRVVDVGCGFGGTIENINARRAGMHLTGINVDPRQLALCRGLRPANGNRLDWREADACELPVEDASVDRVLCFEALFHFRSRRAFFAEAARVLKPGGALVGSDIVVAPAARALDVPGFRIEAALQEVFGPWPDFWSEDADHARLARAAGLRGEAPRDLTAGTLPSHRFTAPAGADAHRPTGNAALDAALMLKWLHQHGHLRYCAFRFDKP